MSLVITYHSLAIDCDSPSDLQRSTGVMGGREVCGKEGGGHGPSDTGLQVSLVVSSSMVYIRQGGEFGPWSVSRAILEVTETSCFGLLTFCPLPSDLPCVLVKPWAVSFREFCLSLILWFSLHEWLCVSQWSVVYSPVIQYRVYVVIVGYNTVVVIVVISLFSSLFLFLTFSVWSHSSCWILLLRVSLLPSVRAVCCSF